jgi:hypothetical protein
VSARSAVLSIKIIADAKQATDELDKVAKKSGASAGVLNKAGAVGAVALGALAVAAVGAAKAAAEDAHSQAILAAALKTSAHATDDQVAATEDWISKTTLATGVADDQLRPALANIARATGDVTKAQEAMGVALDISAATGKDVGQVSEAIAKAYAGNTTALGRLGLGIDKATLKGGDMTKIMDEIKGKVGGAADVAGNTAVGKFKRMQVAINETKEGVGGALLPVMEKFATVLQKVAQYAAENTNVVLALVGVVGALASIMVIARVAMAIQTVATIAQTVATNAASIATQTWGAIQKAATAAQWLWNAAMSANPIGLIILGVIALIAVVVLLWNKFPPFKAAVLGALSAISAAWSAVINWIGPKASAAFRVLQAVASFVFAALRAYVNVYIVVISTLIRWLSVALAAALRGIVTVAGAVFGTVKRFIDPIIGAIQTLIGWVSNLVRMLGQIKIPSLPSWIPGIGGHAAMTPGAARAFSAPAVGLGRAGFGTFATSSGSSGNVVININGAIDPHSTARQIRGILKGDQRLSGLPSPI